MASPRADANGTGSISPTASNLNARIGRFVSASTSRRRTLAYGSLKLIHTSSTGDPPMRTKSATALLLGAMLLITASLAQTERAHAQRIDLTQARAAEREACSRAGGRYEEAPGYFACIEERRSPAAAPSRVPVPGLIQRAWNGLRGFRFGR
jgi:hypothetical protein